MKKKIMASLLATVIMIFPMGAIASDLTGGQDVLEIQPISAAIPQELDLQKTFYKRVTIKVTAIDDYAAGKGWKIVSGDDLVSSVHDAEARIVVSPNTFVLDQAEIKVGDIITGYFDATRPMILIYPPQYGCDVVVVESNEYNVDFDIYNQDLVSRDNFLKLNISEDTEVITIKGKAFTGKLTDRKLVVIYGASTKSIPAQTTPQKIIVLPEAHEKDLVVNNKVITAPHAYDKGQGVIMVPLRAIAEALGYEVKWNGENETIDIGEKFTLKIGEDQYTKHQKQSVPEGIEPFLNDKVTLGIAPYLENGTTYVPLHFFTGVMEVDQAAEELERIVINN